MKESTNHRIRVLFLSSWYPSQEHSTLGNFVQRHAQAVAKLHDVSVIYATPFKKRGLPSDEIKEIKGVKEYIGYFPPGLNTIHKRKNTFLRLFNEYMKVNGAPPDIVQLNVLYPAGNQARWLKKQFKIPFIVTEHWTGYHPEHKTKLRWDQRRSMLKSGKEAAFIAPVSEQLKASMEKWGIEGNYAIVPNVVDTTLFTPIKQPEETVKQKNILHVSSLVDDHKNISGMMRAVKPILEENPKYHLRIIGDGNIKPYEALAKQLNINEAQFSIQGEQALSNIAKAMQEAQLFLMFSRYENLPCVILEAFACGVPVVSTDVGGIKEHLNEDRGILIASEDEKGLTMAVRSALERSWNHEAISAYANSHFSELAIAQNFTSLYLKALGKDEA